MEGRKIKQMLKRIRNVLLTTKAYTYCCGYCALKNVSFSFTCDVGAVVVDAGVCEIITKSFITIRRRRRAPQRSHFRILIFFLR